MRLIAYIPEDAAKPHDRAIGIVIGDMIAPLAEIDTFYSDVGAHLAKARQLTAGSLPLSTAKLALPMPRDAKIVCAAINYVKHGQEGNLPTPGFPNLFARWTSEMTVDGAPIPVPLAEPDGLDWEVELAAIIGHSVTNSDAASAESAVLGYTVANDVSGRASQINAMTLSTGQWALGKNPDRSGAIGSFVETADTIDPKALRVRALVNDAVMQNASTEDMIFSVGDLIAYASRHVTLRPGDVILTGTPEGVGFGRNPRIYMKPGDRVTVEVVGVCSVTNPIVDHTHRG